jgi:hypothetical protein
MIFAARKLQGIGLILLVTLCFLLAYPVHLSVSATRGELRAVEREIAETRARNRTIEGDIAVLANVRQLDRWNSDYFGYIAPTAEQYLPGERAIASIEGLREPHNDAPDAPVLVALVDGADAPAGAATAGGDETGATAETADNPRATLARATITNAAMRDLVRSAPPADDATDPGARGQ